ncbi:Thioesterase/thiol ester dehydrase-isomerase [Armillaria borealis]|uniref:Thioesterase/thiol ester dehydrase-isomerase n=1 Tax=Armillaria borealis TaxID=47425 RepID=A0AA39JZC8_9AGAR|nr:Thioesterase/thiol ester dehydrase-isomerase [Armillaria borealis]
MLLKRLQARFPINFRSRPFISPIFTRRLTTETQAGPSRRPHFLFTGIVAGLGLYLGGAIYPPQELVFLYPRHAPAPPSDLTSPDVIAYTESLEEQLQNLPLLQKARKAEDADEWYETRPYTNFPEDRRVNNLTAGALRGPGKLALPPVVRAKRDESEAWIFAHLGRSLCGHDGIIHGGLLATLLDESLGRLAIVNLPEKVGVTATLSLTYKAPTIADQFVVIKTSLQELQGRKITVTGRIEDLEGKILVEASALFVQPKYSGMLNKRPLHEALGMPTPIPPLSDAENL